VKRGRGKGLRDKEEGRLRQGLQQNEKECGKKYGGFQPVNERMCWGGREHRRFGPFFVFGKTMLFHEAISLNSF